MGCAGQITGYGSVCITFLSDILAQMLQSFLLAIFTVFTAMIILLRRYPLFAFLSLLPNIVLFVLMAGILVVLNRIISLYFTTMMVAAVAMGLVVDDTIQFSHAFKRELDERFQTMPEDETARASIFVDALSKTLESTGRAMVITSMALIAGFSTLILGTFQPTRDVGWRLVIAVLIALLYDLLLFPTILSWCSRSPRMLWLLLKKHFRA